jgi:hypothetical protein
VKCSNFDRWSLASEPRQQHPEKRATSRATPTHDWQSMFRRFLYSKWFFGLLVAVGIIDLIADLGQSVWGWNRLNIVAIGMDVVQVFLCVWIFADIHRRTPKNGDDSGR